VLREALNPEVHGDGIEKEKQASVSNIAAAPFVDTVFGTSILPTLFN
jgi:hypothetical protein